MDKLRQIMYGVTDFARMRAENGYFVDRTGLIRELEKTSFAMFLRPRRFGKSLLCSILQCYYDVDYADRFEELFGGLDIGKNPTDEHGKYLWLDFNFSQVDKRVENVQSSFDDIVSERIDVFAARHAKDLPTDAAKVIREKESCHEKLNALTTHLKGSGVRLYVCIDEYDNFTNTILAESREDYETLCHGEGFFKQFFNELKVATTGVDAPITRLFITGVTPVTMDDVTSGFNIATNISMDPTFAAFTGFTHDDLREMLAYYRANAGFDFDENAVFETMRQWYDNYRFSPGRDIEGRTAPSVANPTLVFYFMQYFLRNGEQLPDLVDRNLRTDYMKIRHIITEGKKINGNFHQLEDIIAKLGTTATLVDSFQARELGYPDNFVSFLFYNGLVTIAGSDLGEAILKIPNLTVGEFMHDFIPKAYQDVYGVDPRIFAVAKGMTNFARHGDWHEAIKAVSDVVASYWKVRDALEGERVIQAALCSLLFVGHGPFIVRHEQESAGGYVDVVFEPMFSRFPEMEHAAILEVKYLKTTDDASPEALAKIRDAAAAQIELYATDHDLVRLWNLREQGGPVTLHRIVLVFHGCDVALCEEIGH